MVAGGGEILCGSTDAALLPEGMKQMKAALRPWKGWTAVVSSPLRRCLEFADWFSSNQGIALQVDHNWREMDFGTWDGKYFKELFASHYSEMHQFYANPELVTPPHGESVLAFRARVVNALSETLQSHRGGHVLVVQHGGTTRMLLAHILNLPIASAMQAAVPYACFTRIRICSDDFETLPALIAHCLSPGTGQIGTDP